MVCVLPGMFPASMNVAPNSPRARVKLSTIPARIPRRAKGNVIKKKVERQLLPGETPLCQEQAKRKSQRRDDQGRHSYDQKGKLEWFPDHAVHFTARKPCFIKMLWPSALSTSSINLRAASCCLLSLTTAIGYRMGSCESSATRETTLTLSPALKASDE